MARGRRVIKSQSCQETIAFGKSLVNRFPKGSIFALHGDLGTGKTALSRGLISGITGCCCDSITSPSFVYLNSYSNEEKTATVHHFDLYRLSDYFDFSSLGFDDFINSGEYCIIEWPEIISFALPKDVVNIFFKCTSNSNEREIHIEKLLEY